MTDLATPSTDVGSPPTTDVASVPKRIAALLRWGRLCTIGAMLLLVAVELAGAHWPLVLITPATPKLPWIAAIGLLLIFATRIGAHRNWRQDRVAIGCGVVAAVYGFALSFQFVPHRAVAAAPKIDGTKQAHTVSILSANVHTGNFDVPRLLDLIDREKPDIILLMEINTPWIQELRPLSSMYRHQRFVPDDSGNFGIGLWTRLPVVESEFVLLKPEEPDTLFDVPHIRALLKIKDEDGESKVVRFFGLHPLPPMSRGNARARDAVLAGVAAEIARDPSIPTLVTGDLNATRYCRVIQQLTTDANLYDALASNNFSWPNTWSSFVTGIRLDHLLVSQNWRVVETRLGDDIGSDHLPTVARLVLTK